MPLDPFMSAPTMVPFGLGLRRSLCFGRLLIAAVVLLFPKPSPGQPAPAKYVVLVSIDGLRPDVYLDYTWPAPFLQRVAREGSLVERVRGVFPTLTYPSHTTMVTGAFPIRHGVFYNSPFERSGSTGLWYWSFDSVRTKTIWESANDAGLTTASVHWPVTLGAPIDFNVPEAWPLDWSMSRLGFLRSVSRPPGILEEIEREATGRLVDYDSAGPTERWRYRFLDAKAIEMAAYLLSVYRPNLLTVHLLSLDDEEHNGVDTPDVRETVAAVDGLVGYLWETIETLGIGDSTAVILAGDHGFIETDTLLAPNVWLADAGLMEPVRSGTNWRAAFHAKGGSAFLYVRETDDESTTEEVVKILADLPPAVRSKFHVVSKAELREFGADTTAVLALAARPGTAFSGAVDTPPMMPGDGATHGFLPDESGGIYTGLVARGAGIRHHGSTPEINLTDIAPLVAYLLGLKLDAPDGTLPATLIDWSDQPK